MKLPIHASHAAIALIAFGSGYAASHYFGPSLFGYANAEECAIHTSHRAAAQACYGLYPTADEAKETAEVARHQKEIDKIEPGRYRALTKAEADRLQREDEGKR